MSGPLGAFLGKGVDDLRDIETTSGEPDELAGHRTADRIITSIEDQIVDGRLENRSPLPSERELMNTHRASRAVVREAITALSHRGLVECKPRHRPVVRHVGIEAFFQTMKPMARQLLSDAKQVRDLHRTRTFIERSLVRDAANYATKADIQAMKTALAENEKAIADAAKFYRTDMAFHRVLYQVPKNRILVTVHDALASWLAPQWERLERSPERNERSYLAHEAIFEAVLERDPESAETALLAHLSDAWEAVRTALSWNEQNEDPGESNGGF